MGVPLLYSWLFKKYSDIKKSCKENKLPNEIKCDNLYLDMNQIIHKCAQSNDEDIIIELVFHHIIEILSIIQPRQLLYMAMDGVTPRARMTHQRTNRFLKSKSITTETFDGCNIKPGTAFMSKLSKYLQDNICDRINTKRNWGQLIVILSDANVPGEGEHKIINFIRQQRRTRANYNQNKCHVIYGSDSDLVLLGLLTHERIFLFKCEECNISEKTSRDAKDCDKNKYNHNNEASLTTANNTETQYILIDLSTLSDHLKNELQTNDSLSFSRIPERSIDDWVFICLLFGNDFLPKSPSIDFFGKNINMDHLTDLYKKNVKGRSYLIDNGAVNIDHLVKLLKKVSEMDLIGKGCRQEHYKKKFHADEIQLETTSMKVTADYVKGLCWIFQYYCQSPPSWNWFYPHYYAPFIYDLANFNGVSLSFDENTKPFSPFEQMMATFSPLNVKYLPVQWQSLMLDSKSPIIDFYPTKFELDTDGKRENPQSIAILPFVDENRLLLALKRVESALTSEEQKRNICGYDRLFIHSKNLNEKFKKLCDNNQKKITEDDPIQIQNVLDGGLTGDVWSDDITCDKTICFKYRGPDCYIESSEKDVNNSIHLQATSSQSNPAFPAQIQQQQAPKHFAWGKLS